MYRTIATNDEGEADDARMARELDAVRSWNEKAAAGITADRATKRISPEEAQRRFATLKGDYQAVLDEIKARHEADKG